MNIPELDRLSGSWIIVDAGGRAKRELYDRANVERALSKSPDYTALTAHEYLSNLDMNKVDLQRALHDRLHHRACYCD